MIVQYKCLSFLLVVTCCSLLGCGDLKDFGPDAGEAGAGDAMVSPDVGGNGPDVGPVPPDPTGISIQSSRLIPATGIADTEELKIRGRLLSNSPSQAESSRYKLRGGVVPIHR